MIRAWLRALIGRRTAAPLPAPSHRSRSDAEVWSEEAFYGMADQLYGHDVPKAS